MNSSSIKRSAILTLAVIAALVVPTANAEAAKSKTWVHWNRSCNPASSKLFVTNSTHRAHSYKLILREENQPTGSTVTRRRVHLQVGETARWFLKLDRRTEWVSLAVKADGRFVWFDQKPVWTCA